MIGTRVGLEHCLYPPAIIARKTQNTFGRAGIRSSAGRIEIQHRIDHRGASCDRVANEIADGASGLIKEGFNERTDHTHPPCLIGRLDITSDIAKLAIPNGVVRCSVPG